MKIYELIKRHLKRNLFPLLFYIVVSILLSLLGILAPFLSGRFIDNLISNPSTIIIYKFSCCYIIIAAFQLFLTYVSSITLVKLQNKILFDFNSEIIQKIQRVSLLLIDQNDPAYLNQRINTDCNVLVSFAISFISGSIVNMISFLICLMIITKINAYISLIIILLIISYLFLYQIMKKPLMMIKKNMKEAQAKYISSLQEQFSKIKVIKIFNKYDYFQKKLVKSFKDLLHSNLKNAKSSFILQSSDTLISMFAQIILFIFGGYQIISGHLTIGLFTVLSTYFSNLINSVKYFVAMGNNFIESNVSALRLQELLNLKEEASLGISLNKINNITIKNLSFSYGVKPIIYKLNCSFQKGKIYCISGLNGSGKSTFMNLLIGLYTDYFTGDIIYDGICLSQLNPYFFREMNLSYVGQDPLLFNGTIRENLVFTNEKKYDNKIKEYLKLFKFESYLDISDDEFLNVIINDNNMSGGELRKISIIRSLLKKSSILIMDEPTNSLDINSKLHLIEELKNRKNEQIIILSSHDEIFRDIIDEEISL